MQFEHALQKMLMLPDFEQMRNIPTSQGSYDLNVMHEFLRRLGNPHLELPAVHVTGTKGKGSVAAMMGSILTAASFRTGLYTSPDLHTIRERICINGDPLSETAFASLVQLLWPTVEALNENNVGQITLFELLTAMAFTEFIESGCVYQVLEVGLGGRLDATNVLENPMVSIITSISLDHTNILGDTVGEIAYDKAGIIKTGCPTVTAPQVPEALEQIRNAAQDRGSPLIEVRKEYTWERGNYGMEGQEFRITGPEGPFEGWIPLLGRHQLENTACVLAACRVLRQQGLNLPDNAVKEGLRHVKWPGRLEVLSLRPLIVVDGAHNPYSAMRLREAMEDYFPGRRLILLFGVSSDKDLKEMVRQLAPMTRLAFACRSQHPRARSVIDIAAEFTQIGVPTTEFSSVGAATQAAMDLAHGDDLILGTGSLFTVAEVREQVLGIVPDLRGRQPFSN